MAAYSTHVMVDSPSESEDLWPSRRSLAAHRGLRVKLASCSPSSSNSSRIVRRTWSSFRRTRDSAAVDVDNSQVVTHFSNVSAVLLRRRRDRKTFVFFCMYLIYLSDHATNVHRTHASLAIADGGYVCIYAAIAGNEVLFTRARTTAVPLIPLSEHPKLIMKASLGDMSRPSVSLSLSLSLSLFSSHVHAEQSRARATQAWRENNGTMSEKAGGKMNHSL